MRVSWLFMDAPNPDLAVDAVILPYLPRERIKARYACAPGNELREKFLSPQSSAALAANAFGIFLESPELLMGLPIEHVVGVDLEVPLRFPWSGGRHPCLDVLLVGADTLAGVESKRYEPFRPHRAVAMSSAYRRQVWGSEMRGYEAVRDRLYSSPRAYRYLDAGQLIKHALGLRTAVNRRGPGRYPGKRPVLIYLYAEPSEWPLPAQRSIPPEVHKRHAEEIQTFASTVAKDEVDFCALTYQQLLTRWATSDSHVLQHHVRELRSHFLL